MQGMLEKMKERKPHIFEKRVPSEEEEYETFMKMKKIQKERAKK